MKILLLEDVYKLGRAGDVKKVAPGYFRNYLMPQGMAILATPGAIKQAGRIQKQGEVKRTRLNNELDGVAKLLDGKLFSFAVKASETGRLYGSVSTQMLAEIISEEIGVTIDSKQIESQPLRLIGKHVVPVRLTVDLIPVVDVLVYREGEPPLSALSEEEREAFKATEALQEIDEEVEETEEVIDEVEEVEEIENVEETEEIIEEIEAE